MGRSFLRKRNIPRVGVCLGLIAASTASALPTQYDEGSSDIYEAINPTKSEVLADSINPVLGYVLPSASGTVSINSYDLASSNNGFCQEMNLLQGASRRLADKISNLTAKEEEMLPELIRARKEYFEKKAEAEELFASNRDLQRFQNLSDRLEDIEVRLDDMYDKLDEATEDSLIDKLEGEVDELKDERRDLRKDLREISKQSRDEVKAYKRLVRKAESFKEYYQEIFEPIELLQERIVERRNTLFQLYGTLGKLEGGFASAVYNSGWDENLQTLIEENPGFQFRKARVSEAKLHFKFIGTDNTSQSYIDSLPAILDYSVAGGGQLNDFGEFADSVPAVLTATMRLSTVASCAILNPNLFDIQRDRANVPTFGSSISYKYDAAFSARVRFSYNLNQVYEYMKKTKTKSGFFSTKSKTKVSEDMSNTAAFTADWQSTDSDNTLTREQKEAVEKAVKLELIDEVLHRVGEPLYAQASRLPVGQRAPQSGASVVAEGLTDVCGWNQYCQAGSFILKGLDAVFGSGTSAVQYRKEFDRTASRVYSTQEVRKKPGFIAFNPK